MSVLLYIIFSYLAGAKKNIATEDSSKTFEQQSDFSKPSKTNQTNKKQSDPLIIISGIFALFSLGACLILGLWVFFSGTLGYTTRLESFKSILIWPTLLYFITGTIYMVKKDKQKFQDA
jgi:hypothetical protein